MLTESELLKLIGIKINENGEVENIKDIEEIQAEMFTNDIFIFLKKQDAIHTCFPRTYLMYNENSEDLKRAYTAKGLKQYASIASYLNNDTKDEATFDIVASENHLKMIYREGVKEGLESELSATDIIGEIFPNGPGDDDEEQVESIRSTVEDIQQYQKLKDAINPSIQPEYLMRALRKRYDIHDYIDAHHGINCPRQLECSYLKVCGSAMIGKPCPFIIDSFLTNLAMYLNMIFDHLLFSEKDELIRNKLTVLNIPNYKKQAAIKAASINAKLEYHRTFEATKATLTKTDEGTTHGFVSNPSNAYLVTLNRELLDTLKIVGIDSLAMTKFENDKFMEDLKQDNKKINTKEGKGPELDKKDSTSNLIEFFNKPEYKEENNIAEEDREERVDGAFNFDE